MSHGLLNLMQFLLSKSFAVAPMSAVYNCVGYSARKIASVMGNGRVQQCVPEPSTLHVIHCKNPWKKEGANTKFIFYYT